MDLEITPTPELPVALDALSSKLFKSVQDISEYIEPVVASTGQSALNVHLKLYVVLKFMKEVSKELSAIAERNMEVVAERAEKRMTQDDLDEVRYAGQIFKPDKASFISVTVENKPKVIQWLLSNDNSKQLVKEDYNFKSFESYIKENFITKGITPPSMVSVFSKPILKVTKARA